MTRTFVNHTTGVYPAGANGVPFNAGAIASKGNVITNLHENMAAEQKARTTYDNILRLVDYPDVIDVIKFLREREVVHYQRFGAKTHNCNERNEREKISTPLIRALIRYVTKKRADFAC